MDRSELERLDRDSLIARAEAAGVARARILTRPELVDELLVRSAHAGDVRALRARGFFGRARDLLGKIIEAGLHLPDAVERARVLRPTPSGPRLAAPPLPTVTLAEIYAAQGHRDRAIDTLHEVLAREPDHGAARALLAQLEDDAYEAPAPLPLPPEDEETAKALDADAPRDDDEARAPAATAEVARAEDVDDVPSDACEARQEGERGALLVRWQVRAFTRAHLARTRPGGSLALRVLVVEPTWDGPRTTTRDVGVGGAVGDAHVRDLPARAIVSAAIGWRVGDHFVPVAHADPA